MIIKFIRSFFTTDVDSIKYLPTNRTELIKIIHYSIKNNIIDQDEWQMIEGVLEFSSMRARDILIPRSQMCVINFNDPVADCLTCILDSTHSRVPVIDDDVDKIKGIVLAKDMLRLLAKKSSASISIAEVLRPALFVPESKRLDDLLKSFQNSHNHMAIVVDEYGGVSGLVTIEDVIEQITGDIEDESDTSAGQNYNIILTGANRYVVDALTTIQQFDEYFDSTLDAGDFDTIGGLISQQFGYIPKTGETITFSQFKFKILLSGHRKIKLIEVLPI